MNPAFICLSMLAVSIFITEIYGSERTVHVQGENYKLKKLKDFPMPGYVERVNIAGDRIFYNWNNKWWLLSNNGGTDYEVSPFSERSCYVDTHVPSGNESTVHVKSKGLTVRIQNLCAGAMYCELGALIVIDCYSIVNNEIRTDIYFFDMSKVWTWENSSKQYAEKFPLLNSDFPDNGLDTIISMHVDPLSDQIVFRVNKNSGIGASIWSIKKMTGRWNEAL